jgi:hypothetical protein
VPLAQVFLEKGIQLFYGARSEMFDKEKFYALIKKHLKRHLKEFSHLVRDSQIRRFADYTESNLPKIGTIPLDVNGGSNRQALRIMEQYLSEYHRKVVLFQVDIQPKKGYKYNLFHGAKPGAAILASRVYEKYGMDVPVVPVGIYGSKGLIPLDYMITHLARKPIKIRVGQPLYITSFLEQENPIQSMTAALEESIWGLLLETLKGKD